MKQAFALVLALLLLGCDDSLPPVKPCIAWTGAPGRMVGDGSLMAPFFCEPIEPTAEEREIMRRRKAADLEVLLERNEGGSIDGHGKK